MDHEPSVTTSRQHHQSAEQSAESLIKKAELFSQEDPARALAAAFGAGVLLNVLPTRFIIGAVAGLAALAVRPTLMTLGVIKAVELYASQTKNKS